MLVPLTDGCIDYVAAVVQVAPNALRGLRATEGGRVGAITANRAGDGTVTSYDIGPFQINDRAWVGYFARSWRLDQARTFALLRDNGCANALAAGVIFKGYLREAKGDYGIAVGFYNSHTPQKAATYRRRFILAFRRMTAHG